MNGSVECRLNDDASDGLVTCLQAVSVLRNSTRKPLAAQHEQKTYRNMLSFVWRGCSSAWRRRHQGFLNMQSAGELDARTKSSPERMKKIPPLRSPKSGADRDARMVSDPRCLYPRLSRSVTDTCLLRC